MLHIQSIARCLKKKSLFEYSLHEIKFLVFACIYYLFAASILELFTIEMLALLRLTCKMIFDVHHRGICMFLLLI
jgi:hypothetical protein